MREITQDGLREMFSENSDHVFVFALSIYHDDWDEVIRVVSNNEDLNLDGRLFTGFPFETSIPAQSDGGVPKITVSTCNIERRFIDVMREVSSSPSADVEIYRVSPDGTTTKETTTLNLSVNGFICNESVLSFNLSFNADYLNEPASKDRFLPSNCKGLFR